MQFFRIYYPLDIQVKFLLSYWLYHRYELYLYYTFFFLISRLHSYLSRVAYPISVLDF